MNQIRVKLDFVLELKGDPADGISGLPIFQPFDLICEGVRNIIPNAESVMGGARMSLSVVKPRRKR